MDDGNPSESGRIPVKRAVSSGGVVFRPGTSGPEIALVRVGHGRWALPKGGLEDHETPEQAAVREVREESGLEAEIVDDLGEIDYWFYWKADNVRYHKFVHFYLMRYLAGSTADHDREVEESCWFPAEEAEQKVAYPTEAKVLALATELLAKK